MIRLDIQIFAKSASQARTYRQAKAREAFAREALTNKMDNKPSEEKPVKKREKGEAVTAVGMRETYELYRVENGKETPVIRDGATVTRTGAEILKKMTFNKRLGVWVSNAKGLKYRVRRR
jgi:hypothetical protein